MRARICDYFGFQKAMYVYTISSIRMKSHCTSTTMGSLIVSLFQIDDEPRHEGCW